MTACPVPACGQSAPHGGVFCADHYFQIPTTYSRLVNRTMFACQRASSDDDRQHLRRQLAGYVQVAIGSLGGSGGAQKR